MKTKIYIAVILFYLIGAGLPMAKGSPQNINEIVSGSIPEYVNLMTDRNLYIAGEPIWFTASCLLKDGSGPGPFSQVLYIELYNIAQKTFVQEKFKLTNGRVTGYIQIPEELPSAHYFLRAYTMYMRNFPPESYFTTSLIIMNPEFPWVNQDTINEIRVFTEGNQLIARVENRVVLEVPLSMRNNLKVAEIIDSVGMTIQQFKMYDNGISTTKIIPDDSLFYRIKYIFMNGDTLYNDLPPIDESGSFLHADLRESEIICKLIGAKSELTNESLNILVWSQDFEKLLSLNVSGSTLSNGITIQREKLAHGLNYIELNSSDGRQLHLITVCNFTDPTIHLPVSTSKTVYTPREEVELSIEPDITGKDIDLLQVAVVKKGTGLEFNNNLPSIFAANPQLLRDAGILEITPSINDQIEAALMLHSLRIKNRFSEYTAARKATNEFVPDIRDISVSGLVIDKKTGNPLEGIRVFASVLHDEFQFHSTRTNKQGRFVFNLPHLEGKRDLFLSTENDSTKKVEIKLNNDFSTDFIDLSPAAYFPDIADRKLLEEMLVNQQVATAFEPVNQTEVVQTTKIPEWFGGDMIVVKLSDYIALSSLQEVFNEIVTWVKLKEKNGRYYLTVYDDQSELTYDDPLVLLDGIPINDAGIIMKLYPAQIDRVEVLNRIFILGDFTIRGLISIRTKTDNFGGVQLPEDVVFVNYRTRTLPAQFNPATKPSIESMKTRDPWFSTMLYYATFDILPAKGAKIHFYTSDHQSEYNVIITGKTRDNELISGESSFKVLGH